MTKISLKKLKIENFKGIREKEISFANRTFIRGKNGVGKTTIATAWFWLLCNKDSFLTSNPNIFPIGEGEYIPTVTATLDVNGVELTISKSQKRKVSKPNEEGISKISTTNNYEINSVEVSERDFYKTLEEKGFDPSNFAITSHTESFMSLKSDERRKVLFGFSEKADEKGIIEKAIKSGISLTVIPEKINSYTLEEIESMAKASIRKVREVYGKDGELLNAQIVGLDKAKVDVELSVKEINAKLEAISAEKEQIAINDAKIKEEYAEKSRSLRAASDDATAELRIAMDKYNKLTNDAERDTVAEIRQISAAMNELSRAISEKNNKINQYKTEIHNDNNSIAEMKETVRQLNEKEGVAILCPTCGQPLPPEKSEKITEANKATKLSLLDSISSESSRVEELTTDVENLGREVQAMEVSYEDYRVRLEKLEYADAKVKESKELKDIKKEIEVLKEKAEKAMKEFRDFTTTPVPASDANRISELMSEYAEYSKLIATHDSNDKINIQIADLRNKQIEYEQTKADAEKVLDELDRLSKYSNEIVTEQINKLFGVVEWKFFDYKKNGEYTEVCDAYVDGKKLGESANTGRELIAKVDIATSLQKMFNQTVPLFVDGFECLSSDSIQRLDKVDSQLIALSVSEDKELTLS